MGLRNREQNIKYVRIKEGKFYLSKDAENSYEELEGKISNMYYKDEEYEGNPVRKLIIVLKDGEDTYQLGLNVQSANYNNLVSFLYNVNINKPVTLHPKHEKITKDGKEVTRQTILVSQNGVFAQGYFTRENKHGLPDWGKVKVGNKVVIDKSESLQFLENFVTENFINKLEHRWGDEKAAAVKDNREADAEVEKFPWDE